MTPGEKLVLQLWLAECAVRPEQWWTCTHPHCPLDPQHARPAVYALRRPPFGMEGWGACEEHIKDLEWIAMRLGSDPEWIARRPERDQG